jgi:hypothetical protein
MVLNATFNNIFDYIGGSQIYWWRKPEYLEKSFLIDVPHDLVITLPHSSLISVLFACFVFVLCFSISGLVIYVEKGYSEAVY